MKVKQRREKSRLVRAGRWPTGLSEEKLAEFVSTHDLSNVIGTGKPVDLEFAAEALKKTREKRVERLLVALRLDKRDLEVIKQIARERDVPNTSLMRSWIRAGLRREKVKAS